MEARNDELTLINNTVPRFNFDELSWGDSLKLTEAQVIIVEISEMDKVPASKLRDMQTAFLNTINYLAKVCVFIPQSWLANGAPMDLDWSNPASFGYIKQKNIPKLMKAMNEAQVAEKNE